MIRWNSLLVTAVLPRVSGRTTNWVLIGTINPNNINQQRGKQSGNKFSLHLHILIGVKNHVEMRSKQFRTTKNCTVSWKRIQTEFQVEWFGTGTTRAFGPPANVHLQCGPKKVEIRNRNRFECRTMIPLNGRGCSIPIYFVGHIM